MKKYGENGENMTRIGSCSGKLWPKIQNLVGKWQLTLRLSYKILILLSGLLETCIESLYKYIAT